MQTLCLSLCITAFAALPLVLESARRFSKFFFLLGTGALAGIFAFDLIPDLFEMGGTQSLWAVGVVWLLYSLAHLSHLKHHDHGDHSHGGSAFFLLSMVAHCLASGMLLAASQSLNQSLSTAVFWALFAHKGYEALTVSSVLLEREKTRSRTIASVAVYSLSLPAGVALTYSFRSYLTPFLAMLVTSLAAGTLLGCLIFDFLVPCIRQTKNRRIEIGWIVAGLFLTQFLMRTL
jgi:zinc transporter ZupT